VRIVRTPYEHELDGLNLSGFLPGMVVDVSPNIASWLIAQHYAELEMRTTRTDERVGLPGAPYVAHERRRR
jgi:hypothetical protein